jgi:glycosyltransferase involved in cell wall biosynthesis
MLKIVQFTTDNREQQNDYGNPEPHFGTAPQALLEGFSQLAGVEVHVVSCVRSEVRNPGKILGNIHYHPVMVPKLGWMSMLYAGCIRATSRLVRELSADIVHGQGTERDCAMNAVHSGLPSIVTIHGNMAELNRLGSTFKTARAYGYMASRLETHSLGRAMGVLCNSAYTEGLVAPRARRTWRVPNAIRSRFFQRAARLDKPQIPTLVNVGLISPRKRQLELLRIIGGIVSSGKQVHVVFAGGLSEASAYGAAFAAELRKAEKAGYASFVGFLDEPGLIDLLDSSHAFLHFPSEEAFGLVVAEAMARGLKFFGANLGGIVDIADGVDGAELHDDFESLQTGIVKWLDAGAPAPLNASSEIASRYHPLVVAEQHVEIYRDVLAI